MKGPPILPSEPITQVSPLSVPTSVDTDPTEIDLHLVEPGRPERADRRQQRQAFQARCQEIAFELARTSDLFGRLDIYRDATARELTTAAALYPELMPKLNSEWEWIAISLADLDDD